MTGTPPRPPHFLRVSDRTADQLVALFERAVASAATLTQRRPLRSLEGHRVALWWDGPGFRNRAAFELGLATSGAATAWIPGPVDGGRAGAGGEDIADVGAYLGNWFDAVVVRTPSFEALTELAASTSAMVVNARTSHNHPCEILGDLAHLHASGHDPTAATEVVFVGAATNLCHSWLEAATVLPLRVTQACPAGHEADVAGWRRRAPDAAGSFEVVSGLERPGDLEDLVASADVVYTDCWPADLGDDDRRRFRDLQITAAVLDRCGPSTHFLPCPPVTRGQEVSADAMEHPRCRVVEAKRWLLHAQQALLEDALAD